MAMKHLVCNSYLFGLDKKNNFADKGALYCWLVPT